MPSTTAYDLSRDKLNDILFFKKRLDLFLKFFDPARQFKVCIESQRVEHVRWDRKEANPTAIENVVAVVLPPEKIPLSLSLSCINRVLEQVERMHNIGR